MIIFKYISLALCLQFTFVCCGKLENATVADAVENSTSTNFPTRKARASYDFVYADLIGCAVQSDPSCLVNVAEDFLSVKKNELLAQADQEVIRATGRADPGNSPSELTKTIEKLISELSGLFRNGISRFFRDAGDDEDEQGEEENGALETSENKDSENRDIGAQANRSARKKKKYGPIKKLVHKIMFLVIILFTLKFALKFYYAFLATKHWLISKGYFLLYAIKLYFWLKHKKWDHHEVAYEHSTHDFHAPHDHHLPPVHHVLGYGEHDKDYSTHVTYEHQPYWDEEDHAGYGHGHHEFKRRKFVR